MGSVHSLNVGVLRPVTTKSGSTGIDKLPTAGPVEVTAPGPDAKGTSGVAGDVICDSRHHGGDRQAVYAYAREDLDFFEGEIGAPLRSGQFGENLTTSGIDVNGALVGETWGVGDELVLQVTSPRIPCATFQAFMGRPGWVKRFTRAARPGAYLRVLEPGTVRRGDPVVVSSRPVHNVSIATTFRAVTLEPELLGSLLEAAEYLDEEMLQRIARREPFELSGT